MPEYYFCLKHHTVEPQSGCRAKDRLGPYESEAAAARALDKVEERNESWDNDPAWNDDVDPGDGDAGDAAGGRGPRTAS